MNYWAIGKGSVAETESSRDASSLMIQDFLRSSRVVKTLNHIGYHEMEEGASPAGIPGRLALGMAGDAADAKTIVAGLIDHLGFDSLDLEELRKALRQAGSSP